MQKLEDAQPLKLDTVVRTYDLSQLNYKLQANDQISVQFESLTPKEFDFLSATSDANVTPASGNSLQAGGKTIDQNGEIPFPFIGKVKLAGKTIFEAQEYLQEISDKYLDSPIVKVRLLNFRITFLGEVLQEGTVSLSNNKVSLLEAIGWVGGLTDFGDRQKVKIVRTWGNKTEVQYVNLLDENFINSPYYFVHPNDVIIVPPSKGRPFLKYSSQNLVLLATLANLVILVVNLSR
jgi:polysaccharide biosynthesis/export protein